MDEAIQGAEGGGCKVGGWAVRYGDWDVEAGGEDWGVECRLWPGQMLPCLCLPGFISAWLRYV